MKFFALVFVLIAVVTRVVVALKDPICGLPDSADGINGLRCIAYRDVWSYKEADNECVHFVYGGCGGNANRFDSPAVCEAKCKE